MAGSNARISLPVAATVAYMLPSIGDACPSPEVKTVTVSFAMMARSLFSDFPWAIR